MGLSRSAAVLLIQALSVWNEEHMGRLPSTADEKAQFRALLQSWQRSSGGVPLTVLPNPKDCCHPERACGRRGL